MTESRLDSGYRDQVSLAQYRQRRLRLTARGGGWGALSAIATCRLLQYMVSRCYALPLVDALIHNQKRIIIRRGVIRGQGRRGSRSSRFKVRRGSRFVEVASVVDPTTLQTNGESEIVKVYP